MVSHGPAEHGKGMQWRNCITQKGCKAVAVLSARCQTWHTVSDHEQVPTCLCTNRPQRSPSCSCLASTQASPHSLRHVDTWTKPTPFAQATSPLSDGGSASLLLWAGLSPAARGLGKGPPGCGSPELLGILETCR